MKNKILIIGQAPPAVKQEVPYDTTLLYEMLSWVEVSKEQAQELFDFEAVSNTFPGINKQGGHKPPSLKDMERHWDDTLLAKVCNSEKIILLGKVAHKQYWIRAKYIPASPLVIELPHPSKRNYSRIMDAKDIITKSLKYTLES
jgi:uracil-DNA glycosylase